MGGGPQGISAWISWNAGGFGELHGLQRVLVSFRDVSSCLRMLHGVSVLVVLGDLWGFAEALQNVLGRSTGILMDSRGIYGAKQALR